MRNDLNYRVTIVDSRLENLNLLTGDPRTTKPPDQFFRFARKHGANNYLDPTRSGMTMHNPFVTAVERQFFNHKTLNFPDFFAFEVLKINTI